MGAIMSVGEGHDAPTLVWHLHAQGGRTCVRARWQVATGTLVDDTSVALVWRLCGKDVGTGAIAWVDKACLGELLQITGVDVATLALPARLAIPF